MRDKIMNNTETVEALLKTIDKLEKENGLLREVHHYARGVMRHNGIDKNRTNIAYDSLTCAVHEVNDFDNNHDDEV